MIGDDQDSSPRSFLRGQYRACRVRCVPVLRGIPGEEGDGRSQRGKSRLAPRLPTLFGEISGRPTESQGYVCTVYPATSRNRGDPSLRACELGSSETHTTWEEQLSHRLGK